MKTKAKTIVLFVATIMLIMGSINTLRGGETGLTMLVTVAVQRYMTVSEQELKDNQQIIKLLKEIKQSLNEKNKQ